MAELGLWRIAASQPDRPAVVDVDHRTRTAGELARASNRLVHALRSRGLQPDDVVATLVPNGFTYVETLLACQQAGWHLVPINHHLAAREVAYIVEDAGAKAFIGDVRFADLLTDTAPHLTLAPSGRFSVGGEVAGFGSYEDLLDDQPGTLPEDRLAGGIMTYTSGTTGQPKGVKRPLPGIDPDEQAMRATFLNAMFGLTDPDHVHLVVAPLYHTAVVNFAQAALHAGHRLVLMDGWSPEGTLERIERYGVTSSHMVPTMFNRLLKLPDEVREAADVSSLRCMIHSAAPCPVDLKRAMLDWWGPVIYEYYAATEGGGTIATPEDWERKPGTVGKPWPISEVVVLDDDGRELPPGEVGTVWMRMGEHRFEYRGDPEKTQQAWNERGFFTVGDVGELDEDGFLFLRDRKVDMIISGGVNIYPAEIESVLLAHPAVLDVAVFGVPNDDFGEEVKAAVEVTADRTPGPDLEAELIAHCREHLGGYKVPRSVDFPDTFPRDPNGKVYKRRLRDPYWVDRTSALV
ncbi:acyl-CoA synthetase [Nitriliruptor alkaliphilus]|uniref:acyl-CoA synthetase n=1 Tax=Nitriliruptor alkaliphilus TaxID=427918 RepID=UPI000697C012|nr:acyl-CoA synthetase [Nitriliruptor alkaliphilus]